MADSNFNPADNLSDKDRSKGGKIAHEKGTAHEFTSEEARKAGRKGGEASGGNNSSSSS